jgi:hypothetical protein
MNGYASDLLGRLIETSSVGRPFAVCACHGLHRPPQVAQVVVPVDRQRRMRERSRISLEPAWVIG